MRVALIDDDNVQLQIYLLQLQKLGASVTTFKSGVDFLNRCNHECGFDLIVVDYVMPKMNGVKMISCLPIPTFTQTLVCVLTGGKLEQQDQIYMRNRGLTMVQKKRTACDQIWFDLQARQLILEAPIQVFPPCLQGWGHASSQVMMMSKRTAVITGSPRFKLPAAFTPVEPPKALKAIACANAPGSVDSSDSGAQSEHSTDSAVRYPSCRELSQAAAKAKGCRKVQSSQRLPSTAQKYKPSTGQKYKQAPMANATLASLPETFPESPKSVATTIDQALLDEVVEHTIIEIEQAQLQRNEGEGKQLDVQTIHAQQDAEEEDEEV